MSVVERHRWVLRTEKLREWVASFILTAPLGCAVTIEPEGRSDGQNRLLHGLISDAVRGGLSADNGERLDLEDAKTAFVIGWMIESGQTFKVIAFSGRAMQMRRSTTGFSKPEMTSLIEFIQFECGKRGIPLRTDHD
jgi:hypothetical protein